MTDETKKPLATSPKPPDENKKEAAVSGPKQEESEKLSSDEGENPDQMLGKIQSILNEYNNEESAIPLESEYWTILNRYRAAVNKPEPKDKK